MFNDKKFIVEFANFVKALDVSSALEIGCFSGELIDALSGEGVEVAGIDINPKREDIQKADIFDTKPIGNKLYDVVFSSGFLGCCSEEKIVDVIKKMAYRSRRYILNYVPNSDCAAYLAAKKKTKAPWKAESDFTTDRLAKVHEDAGLAIVNKGVAGKEWAKRFGPEPSGPYLVWVLAEKIKKSRRKSTKEDE